jgi:Holliday junction resolvase
MAVERTAPTNSARKGKVAERELARLLRKWLGSAVVRNLDQVRDGGSDLLGIAGWALECKRAARPRVAEWWAQTCRQAAAVGLRPALCYRLDRQPWRAVVALRDVTTGFERVPLEMRLETDLESFCAMIRESLAAPKELEARWNPTRYRKGDSDPKTPLKASKTPSMPVRDCIDCREYTRRQVGPHEYYHSCDLNSPHFLHAETCPDYRPPPKPRVPPKLWGILGDDEPNGEP